MQGVIGFELCFIKQTPERLDAGRIATNTKLMNLQFLKTSAHNSQKINRLRKSTKWKMQLFIKFSQQYKKNIV